MGYVHDTAMSQFTGPEDLINSAGTWTMTNASNTWYARRTAANATWVSMIPIKLPANSVAAKGAYLQSIDIWWTVTTEAMDAVAAALYVNTLPANAAAHSAAAVTTSYDTGHDTAAERLTLAAHKMTLTLTTPIWIDNDQEVYVELSGDGGANGVFDYYGARANYTLRL